MPNVFKSIARSHDDRNIQGFWKYKLQDTVESFKNVTGIFSGNWIFFLVNVITQGNCFYYQLIKWQQSYLHEQNVSSSLAFITVGKKAINNGTLVTAFPLHLQNTCPACQSLLKTETHQTSHGSKHLKFRHSRGGDNRIIGQHYPQLQTKFMASLGYFTLLFQKPNTRKNEPPLPPPHPHPLV